MTQIDIAPEISRRIREIYKCLPYVLVPFVLEMIAAAMHASPLVAAVGFAAIVIGLIIFLVNYYRLRRCPVCNQTLLYLFDYPLVYDRRPHCHTAFICGPSNQPTR